MALPPIGTPVANTQVYVLDANNEPVPVGLPGELYLGGAQIAKGYINRPELTAEKFLSDPYSKHASGRIYRTGDRVRFLPDGNLEYLGRTDDQVKWRGFRIEPGEIETVLMEHASVKQAAVLLREDNPGDRRLVGYVVGAEHEPDTETLKAHVKEQLPDYMVPSILVAIDALPLTPSGKLARHSLPAPNYGDAAQRYVAPRDATEEALVGIWAEVLAVDLIGVHDDFFELGGHSLLATQLISRVRDTLAIEMPLKYLFHNPTPGSLAVALQALLIANSLQDANEDNDEEREEFEL
jgi:acyl carrier protein